MRGTLLFCGIILCDCMVTPVKGVELPSLKRTSIPSLPADGSCSLCWSLVELERACNLEDQREGVEIAKGEGDYIACKPVAVNEIQFSTVCVGWRDD